MVKLARPIGDLDLHLFGEGTHRRLWELLGPQPLHVDADGTAIGIRFALWAPDAESVSVVGDWNGGETPAAMSHVGVSGIWSTMVPLARSGHRYAFDVVGADGSVRLDDPMARRSAVTAVGMVPDVGEYEWGDDAWMRTRCSGPSATDWRIRPAHLGEAHHTDTDGAASWEALAARLVEHVATPGSTHVELPVASESAVYAPFPRLGEPDDLRRFVERFHARGVGVIATIRPARTSHGIHHDGGDLLRNEVRNMLIANALYWLEEFHVDGVRLVMDGVEPALAEALARELVAVVGEEFDDAAVIID